VGAAVDLVLELLLELADKVEAVVGREADLLPYLAPHAGHLAALVRALVIPSLRTLPLYDTAVRWHTTLKTEQKK
jgi:hypothetical protein